MCNVHLLHSSRLELDFVKEDFTFLLILLNFNLFLTKCCDDPPLNGPPGGSAYWKPHAVMAP